MLKLPVLNREGKVNGEVSLPESIFSYPIKKHILYESVVNYLANQRQGTASTKTRGEVSGSNRKPWRQKEQVEPGWEHPISSMEKGRDNFWSEAP